MEKKTTRKRKQRVNKHRLGGRKKH
ncbi:hypothetical protein M8C21_004814, partial [Ambrosia artemisiifolia]